VGELGASAGPSATGGNAPGNWTNDAGAVAGGEGRLMLCSNTNAGTFRACAAGSASLCTPAGSLTMNA
jgi:hypothetical protein